MSSLHHPVVYILYNIQYDMPGYEKMPVLEALNGYRLKLPCEAEEEKEEEEEEATPATAEQREGEAEGEGEMANGSAVLAPAPQ